MAPWLVPLLFGEKWAPAIVPLQLVCLGSLVLTPTRLLRSVLLAAGRAGAALRSAAITLAILMGGFAALTATMGLPGAGLAYVVAAGIGLGIHSAAARDLVEFPRQAWLRVNAFGLVSALAASLIAANVIGLLGVLASAMAHATLLGALVFTLDREAVRHLQKLGGLRGSARRGEDRG